MRYILNLKSIIFLFLFISLFNSSCKKGCTDPKALNSDFDAKKDDGSCEYSKATFYARYGVNEGVVKIDLMVNGNFVGSIDGVNWPSGPGNCSAIGTIPFQFENGETIDWNTLIYLSNGNKTSSSGELSPQSFSDCIKVNITP